MIKYLNGVKVEPTEDDLASSEYMSKIQRPSSTPEEQGITLIRAMAATATTLTDAVALSIPDLINEWEIGESVVVDNVRKYNNKTYRCRQDHTTQADWTPDKTPALWSVIELVASGTKDDPITAARGMEYEYGKYYKDPEDNKVYLCSRVNTPDGGKVVLQYLPHELIGNYFSLYQ